jgi:hypothetical protein
VTKQTQRLGIKLTHRFALTQAFSYEDIFHVFMLCNKRTCKAEGTQNKMGSCISVVNINQFDDLHFRKHMNLSYIN